MSKEKPLNEKKFWVRDYDLTDFHQQVKDGLDDCVMHTKDVKEAVDRLKESVNYGNDLGMFITVKEVFDKIKEEFGDLQ